MSVRAPVSPVIHGLMRSCSSPRFTIPFSCSSPGLLVSSYTSSSCSRHVCIASYPVVSSHSALMSSMSRTMLLTPCKETKISPLPSPMHRSPTSNGWLRRIASSPLETRARFTLAGPTMGMYTSFGFSLCCEKRAPLYANGNLWKILGSYVVRAKSLPSGDTPASSFGVQVRMIVPGWVSFRSALYVLPSMMLLLGWSSGPSNHNGNHQLVLELSIKTSTSP